MGLDTKKMKSLREDKGWTQEQCAQKAGMVNKQQWNQIETGKRTNITIDTLENIASVLGVKPKDLLK